ncbi:hypothetical protein JTB14_012588 [Gonioctena quinquepunctata]|nr:hypothetical protein JTB14_012588 [Gonioctena quinquepunctata]
MNCDGPHKSNFRGCSEYSSNENAEKPTPKKPPRPPRATEETHPRNVETSPLTYLLSALDELKDLIKRMSMLANLITQKNCTGAAENAENIDLPVNFISTAREGSSD